MVIITIYGYYMVIIWLLLMVNIQENPGDLAG